MMKVTGSAVFDVRALLFIVPSGLVQRMCEMQRSLPKITTVFDQATNIFTEASSYHKSFTMAASQCAANDCFCPISCPSQIAKNTISFLFDHIGKISN